MARDGEITAEEYGRRMLEMKERKSAYDPYTISQLTEEAVQTLKISRNNEKTKGNGKHFLPLPFVVQFFILI